ncbi:MAG: type IV toxin-antitoxin system AbiEi family antitoxin domain-containing protein, partial [Acidimicrobiales bacterium]
MADRATHPHQQQAIDERARVQHGLVTRRQLTRIGLTRAQIDHALTTRRLVQVHRGVFRVGGAPITSELQLLAACLAGGPQAVASHAAAAWLWDCSAVGGLVPEVTVPNPRQSIAGVRAHRRIPSPHDSRHDHL